MEAQVSIRRKFLARFALSATLVMFAYGAVNSGLRIYRSQQELLDNNKTVITLIKRFLQSRFVEIEEDMGHVRYVLENVPSVKEKGQVYLDNLISNHYYMKQILILDPKGLVRKMSPYQEDIIGNDFSSYGFFQGMEKNRKGRWTSTFLPHILSEPTSVYLLPYNQGFICVILQMAPLIESIKYLNLPEKTNIGILDRQNRYLVHTLQKKANTREQEGNADEMKWVEKDKGFFQQEVKTPEGTQIYNMVHLKEMGWKVIVSLDKDEIYETLWIDIALLGFFLLIALLSLLLLASVFLRRIFQILKGVEQSTHVIAEGIYELSVPGKEYVEFEELARNFENMARAIRWREQKILDNEARLKASQDIARLGFWEYYPDVDSVILSPIWEDWLDFSQEKQLLTLAGFLEFMEEDQRVVFQENLTEVIRWREKVFFEIIMNFAKAEKKNIEVRLEYDLKAKKITGTLQDISEQKSIEQNMKAQTLAREVAEEANRAKDEFLALVSHELRTPLTSIIGMADTIKRLKDRGKLDEGKLDMLVGNVLDAGEHLADLVEDILDYSKLEAGTMVMEIGNMDFSQGVREVVNVLEMKSTQKGLLLENKVDSGLVVKGDERRVKQIIMNLVDNAIKFTEAGSVILKSRMDEEYVMFAVEDTGLGINSSDQEIIFHKFVRLDKSGQSPGTGLGLAISRQLARMMGGEIEVFSKSGQGTIFTLKLKKTKIN